MFRNHAGEGREREEPHEISGMGGIGKESFTSLVPKSFLPEPTNATHLMEHLFLSVFSSLSYITISWTDLSHIWN